MQDYMNDIPIHLVTAERIARRGAALLYREHLAGGPAPAG